MTSQNLTQYHIAILIPCYNETKTIKQVVKNFQSVVPHALIYVYDNNSTGATFTEALAAGAIVRKVKLQGKGNVVRRMFADVESDIYIMVDGDATYDASMAPKLIDTLLAGPNDMVNAARVNQEKEAYRFGHVFGNKLLTSLVTKIFGKNLTDML